MPVKKIPLRKCIGCGEMKAKKELIRVVRSPEGEISIDRIGKKPGRGAYLCDKASCMNKAKKNRGLEHAFSCQIDGAVYEQLINELQQTD